MFTDAERIPSSTETKTNLVVFRLGRDHYALPIEPLQQIIEMVTITPVLKTEAWIEGVINYHGVSVPVVNLRRHFGLDVIPYHWHTPMILVNIEDRPVALIVDDVVGVLDFAPEQIASPDAILPDGVPHPALLQGVVRSGLELILLLALTHVFDREQVRALQDAAEALASVNAEAQQPGVEPEAGKPDQAG